MLSEEFVYPSIRVECNHCGARPDEVCRMPSGVRYHGGAHQARRQRYFSLISRKSDPRYYAKARDLIRDVGGRMEWKAGGNGGGGQWRIELYGKTHAVPVRDLSINDLDKLYVPEEDEPRTLLDYGSPGTLRRDAFWRLVDLFKE